MKFRTEYIPPRHSLILSPAAPLLLTGSCFADNMARRMQRARWEAANPAGVLFNPLSIARVLELTLLTESPEAEFRKSLFNAGGVWHSWLFDSALSARSEEECLARFNDITSRMRMLLNEGRRLCVTFGTAWCYFLAAAPNNVVANCHKQPQRLFERRRISTADITAAWLSLIPRLRERYPRLEIIFTVSPVRHIRDGLHENALSKSILLLATEEICTRTEGAHYFPAYEILCDDLRDYRFYANDLVHPSEQAVEYIWEKFCGTFLDSEGLERLRKGEMLTRRLEHRPIIPDTPAAREFEEETRRLLDEFNRANVQK
ncbi:MAG: GSCFA domain-containing protein [Muribaculaceae bacterium]|nr:GSCFA domain-containing protein [Muribaculaceae bacterium]